MKERKEEKKGWRQGRKEEEKKEKKKREIKLFPYLMRNGNLQIQKAI